MVAKIASLFTELFKKEILGQVIENTKAQTRTIVLEGLVADYSLVSKPIVIWDFLAMEFNRSIFNCN
jgi:hypothetical protein